jgi:hypothetical protein
MAAGERFVVVGGLPLDDERSSVMSIGADRTYCLIASAARHLSFLSALLSICF